MIPVPFIPLDKNRVHRMVLIKLAASTSISKVSGILALGKKT